MTPEQATAVQTLLVRKGYNIGTSGPDRDGVDGDWGALSQGANLRAIAASPPVGEGVSAAVGTLDLSQFTAAERRKLAPLHPDLQRVLIRARKNGARFRLDTIERSEADQRKAVASGHSQTMDSRHLKSKRTGQCYAADLYPLDDVDHDNVPWDWDDFYALAEQIRAAAEAENVPVRWGGTWQVLNGTTKSAKALVADYAAVRRAAGRKPFLDGPHFELPSAKYPA